MRFAKYAGVAIAALVALFLVAGCTQPSTTTVSFNLTDAPVDSSNIAHIYVQFGGLSLNESGTAADSSSSWIPVDIDSTKVYDLLSLTDGTSSLLGNVPLEAGTQINQIRFTDPVVKVVETGSSTELDCTLNSNSLKIVKAFSIPLTGTLALTVDFDARKSLVYASGVGYKMTPVLRAVVDNEAGKIVGAFSAAAITVPNTSATDSYMVYAYQSGTYDSATETAPDANGTYFADAITGAVPKSDGSGGYTYTLAFLEAGTYDLVVWDSTTATVADDSTYVGVSVQSAKDTTEDIALQ